MLSAEACGLGKIPTSGSGSEGKTGPLSGTGPGQDALPSSISRGECKKRSRLTGVFWSETLMTSFSGRVCPRKDSSPSLTLSLWVGRRVVVGWGRRTDPPSSNEAERQYPGTDLSAGLAPGCGFPPGPREDWREGGSPVQRALGWGWQGDLGDQER